MAKKPAISKALDQNTLTQDELDQVIAVLKNINISADYKLHLLEALILPKEAHVVEEIEEETAPDAATD